MTQAELEIGTSPGDLHHPGQKRGCFLMAIVIALFFVMLPIRMASTPTTTTLASAPNPSTFGQGVTLTVTVSPASATGKVTFYDGVTLLGTSTLSGGHATLNTTLLPSGSRALKAYYGGDATYSASTSAAVAQTVVALPENGFLSVAGYSAGSRPSQVVVGDFNGDGKADLAVANQNGNNVSVLLGNGDGTFQAAVNYNTGTNSLSVAVGDFNGDGKADLAVADYNGNNVSVLLGNGDGTFRAAVNYNAGSGPSEVVVGDFNGDGKADLVVANYLSNNVSVLLGKGDGTFQAPVNYSAAAGPISVAVGDFNGDGRADFAVANYGSFNVSIRLGVDIPVINAGGVVTGANYAAQIAPGVIASVFGSDLSSAILASTSVPLPTALGGISVRANGILTPLFFVSPTQINFQLPWELLGQSQASFVVTVNGSSSIPQTISLRAVSPGIFSTNSSGSGQGAVQIANTAIFAAPSGSISGAQARPALRGEFLSIYCSGLGDVSSRPATGAGASGSPLSGTLLIPTVSIGGVSALVSFGGLSPGFVGLYQVNVQVPNGAPTGGQVPVVMVIGGVSSNTVTIAVQ